MDVAQALAELTELSSQVERAVVLDGDGAVAGSTLPDERATERLATVARNLVAAAGDLHATPSDVTRVEVELSGGAVFVLREGGRMIAAVTGPRPTAGLVAYDLRTCLHGIEDAPRRKRGRPPKPKEEAAGE
jgi:predicted regulator of Ras-like GTPase activity (Roadblock/LC7/MglB family)